MVEQLLTEMWLGKEDKERITFNVPDANVSWRREVTIMTHHDGKFPVELSFGVSCILIH